MTFARAMTAGERGQPSTPEPSPVMAHLARELLRGLVLLGHDSPGLVRQAAGILSGNGARTDPGVLLMKKDEYAKRIGFSVRKLDQFIDAGLPTFGIGRSLRIKAKEADAWLLASSEGPGVRPDDITVDAMTAARRRSQSRRGRRGR